MAKLPKDPSSGTGAGPIKGKPDELNFILGLPDAGMAAGRVAEPEAEEGEAAPMPEKRRQKGMMIRYDYDLAVKKRVEQLMLTTGRSDIKESDVIEAAVFVLLENPARAKRLLADFLGAKMAKRALAVPLEDRPQDERRFQRALMIHDSQSLKVKALVKEMKNATGIRCTEADVFEVALKFYLGLR